MTAHKTISQSYGCELNFLRLVLFFFPLAVNALHISNPCKGQSQNNICSLIYGHLAFHGDL